MYLEMGGHLPPLFFTVRIYCRLAEKFFDKYDDIRRHS